ncbi:MAG: hypothetical protein ACFFDN_13070 [Candidatus Hodarchaeota archaeon]
MKRVKDIADLLKKLLDCFEKEFSNLIKDNSFKLKEFDIDMDKRGYFSIKSDGKVYYNKEKIMCLLFLSKHLHNETVKNTAIYFANHEFTHNTQDFLKFNKEEWKQTSNEEIYYCRKESHEQSYYSFSNLKYIIEDFFVDKAIRQEIKQSEMIFKEFLIQNLHINLVKFNALYAYINTDRSLTVDEKKDYIKDELLETKIFGKIIELSIRLLGLGYVQIIDGIIEEEIPNLKNIIEKVYLSLLGLDFISLDIDSLKSNILAIFEYLDKADLLRILFGE